MGAVAVFEGREGGREEERHVEGEWGIGGFIRSCLCLLLFVFVVLLVLCLVGWLFVCLFVLVFRFCGWELAWVRNLPDRGGPDRSLHKPAVIFLELFRFDNKPIVHQLQHVSLQPIKILKVKPRNGGVVSVFEEGVILKLRGKGHTACQQPVAAHRGDSQGGRAMHRTVHVDHTQNKALNGATQELPEPSDVVADTNLWSPTQMKTRVTQGPCAQLRHLLECDSQTGNNLIVTKCGRLVV
mmetsp:Transcript_29800/g.63417  ORF Transcript_29800/g.63417 Transcript_29800/m.63417 type:complete len:240 (+) Transcript_29800:620-1339(+)